MIKRILLSLSVCILLFLCGCSEYMPGADTTDRGEILTPEYMAEISQKLAEEKDTSSVESSEAVTTGMEYSGETDDVMQLIETTQPTDSSDNVSNEREAVDTVYWTPNGSVWHITKECSSLSRSKNIVSGSESDAIAAGKERVCKRCG